MQTQKLNKFTSIVLSSGRQIPQMGFGTYLLTGKAGISSMITAINSGYLHLDTASMYGNQIQIKKVLQSVEIDRNKIYITSKVGPQQHGAKQSRQAVQKILSKLGCEYLDLILIHWPATYKFQGSDKRNQDIRLETWKTFIQLQKEGKVKDIGVSNFLKHHLEHLFANSQHRPVVNQIQIHPLLWEGPTIQFCRQNNIAIQAYSPLAHNSHKLFKNKAIIQIGNKHKKSVAQICLRWGLQHGFIILPKSGTQSRIKQNIDIYDFELSQQQMATIQEQTKNHVRTDWNPNSIKY